MLVKFCGVVPLWREIENSNKLVVGAYNPQFYSTYIEREKKIEKVVIARSQKIKERRTYADDKR